MTQESRTFFFVSAVSTVLCMANKVNSNFDAGVTCIPNSVSKCMSVLRRQGITYAGFRFVNRPIVVMANSRIYIIHPSKDYN
jgi:hypothetical protein